MEAGVLTSIADGRAKIIFNRPDVRNALNPGIMLAVATFLDEVSRDPSVRYLTFEGAGAHFAAGGDLSAYAKMLAELPPEENRRAFERRVRGNFETILRIQSFAKPIVSLVRGTAAGAGVAFILASDFVIASDDATILFAQPRVGLPLDMGVTYFLPRVVGEKQARQLALTGGRLDAARAQALGIVDEVCRADELEARLAALTDRFAGVAPRAAGRSKLLLQESGMRTLAEQMEAEVQAIGQCVAEPDFAEGVTSFLEKRRAAFAG